MRTGIRWAFLFFLLVLPLVNAQTITLGSNHILADSYVAEDTATTNYGSTNPIYVRAFATVTDRIYQTWNIANFSNATTTVTNALMTCTISTNQGTFTEGVHRANITWGESDITWNNQPCGTGAIPFVDSPSCNATASDSVSIVGTGTKTFNVTNIFQWGVLNSRTNITIIQQGQGSQNLIHMWNTKEDATPANRCSVAVSYTTTATPSAANLTATAADLYDGSSINSFSLSLVRGGVVILNQSTTNGTIPIANITNGMANLTFQSSNYFEQSYYNVNVSGQAFTGRLYQSILYVNASQAITGSQITNFGASAPLQYNQSNSSGWVKLFLKAGSYTITGNTTGYVNNTFTITVAGQTEYSRTFEFGTNRLRVDARSIIDNSYLSSFSILLYNGSYSKQTNTTTGNVTFDLLTGTYYLNFSSSTHANMNASITVTGSSIYPNYTFSVYTTNSINVSIHDEILGRTFPTIKNATLSIVSNNFAQNYTVEDGTFYIDLLSPDSYRLSYYTTNYPTRDYYFTLQNQTNTEIELFLLSLTNSTNVVITIQDENARNVESAVIKMLRYYVDSNSYEIVAMTKTDINGQGRINVETFNAFYYFVVEKDGRTYLTTNPARLIETTLTYGITLGEDVLQSREGIREITTSLTYDNSTGVVRLVYNDASGLLDEMCLVVDRTTVQDKTELCNTCSSSLASTLLCTVNSTGEGLIQARAELETTTRNSPYVLAVIDIVSELSKSAVGKWGLNGVYAFSYMFMALALIGLPFPWLSILFSILGVVFASITGVLGLGYASVSALLIIGGLIIFRVRS